MDARSSGPSTLPRSGSKAVVPLKLRNHPVIHADVEVRQEEDRCLQAFSQVESLHGKLETLVRIPRQANRVPRIAMRGIGSEHQVALLGAGRHAG